MVGAVPWGRPSEFHFRFALNENEMKKKTAAGRRPCGRFSFVLFFSFRFFPPKNETKNVWWWLLFFLYFGDFPLVRRCANDWRGRKRKWRHGRVSGALRVSKSTSRWPSSRKKTKTCGFRWATTIHHVQAVCVCVCVCVVDPLPGTANDQSADCVCVCLQLNDWPSLKAVRSFPHLRLGKAIARSRKPSKTR